MKGKVKRWYNVGSDTVQASSPGEARRIVESMKAFEKKKGERYETNRQSKR